MSDTDRDRIVRQQLEALTREQARRAHVAAVLDRLWFQALAALARRPGTSSAIVWLAIGALVWLDSARPVVTIPHEAAFIGGLIAGIAQAISWIGGHAATVVITLAEVAIMIGHAIAGFAVAIATVLSKVWGFLSGFYSHTLRPFVEWAWRQFDRFVAWLDRTLGPVIKFLAAVRREIDKFYTRWFKPLFDAIDATRRVLQVLARLHVPFAQAIDNHLAYLEAKLLWPIQQIYYRINEVMNWVNRIITLDGYLQQVTLIRSIWKYQREALKVWWESVHRPLTGAARDTYLAPLATRSIEQIRADLVAYVHFGSGPDRARIDEHAADLAIRLRAA